MGFPLPPEHTPVASEEDVSFFRSWTSLGKDFVKKKVMSFFPPTSPLCVYGIKIDTRFSTFWLLLHIFLPCLRSTMESSDYFSQKVIWAKLGKLESKTVRSLLNSLIIHSLIIQCSGATYTFSNVHLSLVEDPLLTSLLDFFLS